MASDIASRRADLPGAFAPPDEERLGAEGAAKISLRARVRHALHSLGLQTFSSLTRRIVVLNVAGLVAMAVGILYLNQFRAGLIEARVQALLTQGEIMASAIAASARVETGAIQLDPDRLLDQQVQDDAPDPDELALEFPINPERVAPLLRRLVSPTKLSARIYDRDGWLVLDSRLLFGRPDPAKSDVPPVDPKAPGFFERLWTSAKLLFTRTDLPLYEELGTRNGKGYTEVAQALGGTSTTLVRVNEKGESIVSVAVPIRRSNAVAGALLLATRPGEIDQIVSAERLAILRVFAVAAGVMIVLSLFLAGTIATPLRKLAESAEKVRHGLRERQHIPDMTDRSDEIGHLSGALRDMTGALFKRIEAIESFAADVAHELKNPLTSLRSAVETLPLAKTEVARARLLTVIQHDVKRLDRLISDISDASRLDAELQREHAEPVDMAKLVRAVADMTQAVDRKDGVRVTFTMSELPQAHAYFVNGHDSRLAQVINNLVDNARSFSPAGGEVRILLRRLRNEVEVAVEDEGPGVPEHAMERIFQRFYTDRPESQGFGQNSGLGLSISKQIIEAHGGQLFVQNLKRGDEVVGARFILRLPAMA